MSQNAANILAGPVRIFLGAYNGVVNPVSATPPALFQHTSGVPSGLQTGFTEIGYTSGAATFNYKATKVEISPEQVLGPVDVFTTEEMVEVTFNVYERTYITLKTALDNIGSVTDSSKDLFYAGSGTSILTPSVYSVFMSHVHRDNVAKFSCACIYKAYAPEGAKLPFEKKKETIYAMTLKGLVDTQRALGDQMFQFFHEK